jgi:DNA-binding NtrC family response regulator
VSYTVYYERPENTLSAIERVSYEQALKLIESFEAQQIACCMEEAEEHSTFQPIVLQESESEYRNTMNRTSWSLVQDALRRTGGNQSKAAKLLGIERTTMVGILRRLDGTRKPQRKASGTIGRW